MAQPADSPTPNPPPRPIRRLLYAIRNRILEGVFLALPIAITFWILLWLYSVLRRYVIDFVARLVVAAYRGGTWDARLPSWLDDYVAPLLALLIVLAVLWLLGWFVHTRLHLAINWFLLRVPVVTTVYAAVNKVFATLQSRREAPRFKRVVLVPFPHPGMRVPGFVTSSCRDELTGRTILCVYVPTTPVPTSGYMLLIPEEDVNELNWDLNETLQAIISGGLSVPPLVQYDRAPSGKSGEDERST